MKEIGIKEWQKELLRTAQIVHDICVKHHIPYYMLGGTMLGAIRHKGFIPWDDDMDFGVMRSDFPRLRKALEEDLPSNYVLRDQSNLDFYFGQQMKVENTETTSVRVSGKGQGLGAFVDIFPLNRTNGRTDLFSRNGLISLLLKLQYYRFGTYKTTRKRIIAGMVKAFFFWLRPGLLSNFAAKYIEPDKGEYIDNYWGAWINKELVHETVMGTPRLYDFEETSFYGVEKPDEYLKHLYGDYMKIPKDQHLHLAKMYRK